MATLRADRRLYVTADRSEIVEEGDPRGAWLLVGEGGVIGESDVQKYRVSTQGGKIVVGGQKMAAPPENKMVAAPENKAVAPSEPEVAPEVEEDAEEWDMAMSPRAYLRRHPKGPNAALARRIVGR